MPSVAIQPAGSLESARPRYEVADIFREYGEQYRRSHSLPLSDLKVMHAIEDRMILDCYEVMYMRIPVISTQTRKEFRL